MKILSMRKRLEIINKSYLISYIDYFEPYDDIFTEFNCENQEGKKKYRKLIDRVLSIDAHAKAFVEVYGEEDDCIYADTLILCSRLSIGEISALINESDVFPSDIGRLEVLKNDTYILNENGDIISAKDILDMSSNIFIAGGTDLVVRQIVIFPRQRKDDIGILYG